MDDVAFVSSRMSGVYVTNGDEGKRFTELTLRASGKPDALLRLRHRRFLVNMAGPRKYGWRIMGRQS